MPSFWYIFLSLLLGCSQNPVTGKSELHFISENQEIAIGEENYEYMQQAEGGPYVAHPSIVRYVEKIGKKLAAVSDRPNLPYEFAVLDNSIPNAWALPGGKIAINRGLLVELHNEAELAAVLGHEIVHSAARHGAKAMERYVLMQAGILGMSQLLKDHKYEDTVIGGASMGAALVALKYSRGAELQADAYGMKYMAAAGYDVQAAVTLQETFLKLSQERGSTPFERWLLTHPPSQERIEANEQTALSYPQGGFVGEKEYQKALEPLLAAKPAYALLDKGYEAFLQKNYTLARSLSEKGIEIEPKEAHLFNLKGKAEKHLGQREDARASFDQAIRLNPSYFDFYLQRGILEYEQRELTLARIDLEKSIELLPSEEAYYYLAQIDD